MSEWHRAVGDADAWVRALVRMSPGRLQWDRVVLAGVGITAPVALALVLAPHDDAAIGAGALASMGALVASAMDVGAAGIERIHRVTFAATVATIGFTLGVLVHGHSALMFSAVIVAGLLSGLSGAISATASRSAIYFLMFTVMAANTDFGLASAWTAPLVFAAGAAWRVTLTVLVAAWAGRSFAPERHAVARVYAALADQLAAEGPAARDRAGITLTAALNEAYDVLVAARSDLAARDGRWQSLVALLDASAPAVDAATAWKEEGTEVDADAIRFLRAMSAWFARYGQPVPPAYDPTQAGDGDDPALAASLRHISDVASRTGGAVGPAGDAALVLPAKTSITARLRAAGRALTTGSELWSSILRLVLCLAVAQALSLLWHLDRPYLVMLTVAQVMKPDFGSVFGRAVQRGLGTLIGVAVGSLAVMHVPRGEWQILVIFILAASIPIVMRRNYGLYAIVTTPLAVLLVELHVKDSSGLLEARLLDTLLGCAIVLLLGYLPWPQTWHAPRHFAEQVSLLARAISRFADVALGPPDSGDRVAMRRDIYRHISDLRTKVAQSRAEPPSISAGTASWLPEIAALEHVADAITAVATNVAAPAGYPDEHGADNVSATLRELASSMISRRMPAELPSLPPTLDEVGVELTRARLALISQQRGTERRHRAH
ncbi:FUSC family protein [Microbacterium aurugineum]|uniref:FUSC family protein n=1 Tax=Microbacterium aurugineum TaxID=2851642 RepID=UPI0020BE97A2|nr:FUSC family protein [Microbacterium aurugineum]MCK8478332.1 FUSC family protein [Microbacterium aurugineum]